MRINTNKQMTQVAFLNVLVGILTIPTNIVIASSLAQAVSALASSNRESWLLYTTVFSIFTVVRLLLTIFTKTYITRLRNNAAQSYKQSLYLRFMRGTSSLHQSEPTRFTTLFRRDAQQVSTYYAETLPNFMVSGIGFVSYTLYICLALEGVWFAVCMVVFGLLSLLQPIILEKFLVRNFIEADQAEAVMAQHLTSGLEGYATLKMLKLHEWFMNKYRPLQKVFWRVGVRASAAGTFNHTMEDINRFLQTLGLVFVLGWAMLNQWTTFAIAMQIFLLSSNVYSYIAKLFQIKSDTATCRAALSQIDMYLTTEKTASKALPTPTGALEIYVFDLCYETVGKSLMEHIDFTIASGEKCLVRGENGSGKSTLLALLMGQIKPTSGQIMINSEPVLLDGTRLRNWIAYCPQAVPAMHCTARELYDHVMAAQPAVSKELLEMYSKELALRDDDLEKLISDLSGGTQKKVALCLALAKQAPLLLLDEPEAMLDQRAAEGLLRILHKQNRTMLIVSHSLLFDDLVDSHITFENRQVRKFARGLPV